MNQYKEDVEIDLVRLFKYLLSKSKILLLIGIVFGLVGLSYKYYDVELSGRSFADEPNLVSYEKNVKQPNGIITVEKKKASYNQFLSEMESRQKKKEVQKALASYEKANIS
jgi:LPS O-antigen subunit length determinant protein (WzzB/FepE family)